MPYRMDEIYHALNRADLFVSIGTSGAVYPAAGFVREARAAGARTLELNMEPSQGSYWFDEARHGPASVLRSEEHTSELQSLMRNSYAVFCLKKKKPNNEIQ